ncbi:MAG TPA: exosortase U [Lacipirellulaceae bacterium]|nr:exosortase U [Lacipirellulaceae bacterium]
MSNSESTAAAGARSAFADPRYSSWAASSILEGQRPSWLVLVSGVLAIAYAPLLWMFFDQQWQKPHYQFFPFVIGAFLWLLWARWQEATPVEAATPLKIKAVRFLQITAALLLLFGLAIRSPWCAMVSLILLVAAAFVRISESRHVVNLWGIWLLLWLMVPPPRNFDQTLITRLQFVSSRLSSFVLDSLGIDHLMDGNTLWLNSKQLFVDEACSGIISMLSIAACAVIYSVVKNRSPFHLVLLTLSSIAWATLINVFRISSIAFALEKWGIDWSAGLPHEILSLVVFLFAFLLLLCTDQVLLVCLSPIRFAWNQSQGSKIRFGSGLVSVWDKLVVFGLPVKTDNELPVTTAAAAKSATNSGYRRWVIPTIFAPIAALQCVLLVSAFELSADRLPAVQTAVQLGPENMPAELCGLHRTDFHPFQRGANNIQGKYSRTYFYTADDGTTYTVSFDFPFPGYWHELSECYVAAGWHPIKREILADDKAKADAPKWRFVDARFAKSGGQHGCLCFSEFDQFGVPYDPQAAWLNESNTFWTARNLYLKERQLFQVQVWSEGAAEWTPQQQQKAHEVLLAARASLREQVVGPASPNGAAPRQTGDESAIKQESQASPDPAAGDSKRESESSPGARP